MTVINNSWKIENTFFFFFFSLFCAFAKCVGLFFYRIFVNFFAFVFGFHCYICVCAHCKLFYTSLSIHLVTLISCFRFVKITVLDMWLASYYEIDTDSFGPTELGTGTELALCDRLWILLESLLRLGFGIRWIVSCKMFFFFFFFFIASKH